MVKSNLIYDSAERKNPALEELTQISHYRHLIFQLTRRDVLTRYKRSFLGIAWTMLNPLGMMVVLTIAFSSIFRFGDIESYPAYVLSGLLAWNFFSQATTASMVNLVWGGDLLQRIYIPRTSFALAAIATGIVNTLLSMAPLVLVMLVTGVQINLSFLLFPIPIILLACFALGVGLLISAFAVYFPDVAEMYQIGVMGWMYLTPIIYPEEILSPEFSFIVTHLNPMSYLVKLFRIPIYYGRLPTFTELIPSVVIALVTLILGWTMFTKKSDEFAYRI